MNVARSAKKNGEIVLTVSLSKKECLNFYRQAIKQIAENFSQKGFRQGKVPDKLVEKRAKSRLILDYENNALQETVRKAILQENITPVLEPVVKILKSVPQETFEYEITITPYPEVKLGNYQGLKFKKKKLTVKEQEIKDALQFLQESRAQRVEVKRAAQEGDQLNISFDAFHNGKKNIAGSSAHYPLKLGKSHLHPKFEKQLYGTQAGDKKSFTIQFPSKWPQKEFEGKKIKFNVTINSVQKVTLPSLDDNFAKSLGAFKSLEHLKEMLKNNLLEEKSREENKRLEAEILQKIINTSKIKIADSLVEKEAQKIFNDFLAQLKKQNTSLSDYLKRAGISEQNLKDEMRKNALRLLQQVFVLKQIAKKEKLYPSPQEVEDEINEKLTKSQNFQKILKDIDLDQLQSYTFEYLTNQKVIKWLLEKNICV